MPPSSFPTLNSTPSRRSRGPLDVRMRDPFLQRVVDEPSRFNEVGLAVSSIASSARRAFFDPRDLSRSNDVSKYRR
jgi:hypothetical protein